MKNMESPLMNLKISLPYKIFLKKREVKRIVVQTTAGSFGFLPQRLDCVAAIKPGILEYETESEGTAYIAIDNGILVKAGTEVMVSVRNAVSGPNLGKLREAVEKTFLHLDESEKSIRTVMAKLESSFIHTLEKFHKQ